MDEVWTNIKKYYRKTTNFMRRYAYSMLLSIGSIMYGIQLTRHPSILRTFSIYQTIVSVLNYRLVGLVFIVLGILKLVGLVFNIQKLRRYSLVAFTYIWSFFGVSLLFSEPKNTVWVLSGIMAALSLVIADRGDFSG